MHGEGPRQYRRRNVFIVVQLCHRVSVTVAAVLSAPRNSGRGPNLGTTLLFIFLLRDLIAFYFSL
jgi:hypothetical protein